MGRGHKRWWQYDFIAFLCFCILHNLEKAVCSFKFHSTKIASSQDENIGGAVVQDDCDMDLHKRGSLPCLLTSYVM